MTTKTSIEEISEISRGIKISIPRNEYDERYFAGVKKAAKGAHIKGFRQGKAPQHVVEKLYGGNIQNDVIEELVGKAYREAIDEHKLNVVGYPKIDIKPLEDSADLEVTASVELFPEPEIKGYEKLKFKVPLEKFSESQVDVELSRIAENFSTTEKIEDRDTVAKEDLVEINYSGEIDGKAFEGSTAENAQIVIGGGSFPEAFETGLLGAKIGVEKELSFDMPKDIANPAIAGKNANYKITVNQILKKVTPELDDDLVKKEEIAESLQELKERISKNLQRDVEQRNKKSKEEAFFKTLFEKVSFQVPQLIVDEEIRQILFEARLLDPSDKKSYQLSLEGFRDGLGEGGLFRAKRSIALERIITQQGIETSDEDLSAWFDQQSKENETSREEIEKIYDFPKSADRLKSHVAKEKVMDMLLADSLIEEVVVEAGSEEAKKIGEES